MNDNSYHGKMPLIWFDSVNVEEHSTYLSEKISLPGAKINTIFRLSLQFLNHIIIKTF